MPSLKQLICSLEWSGSGIPLPEYHTSYGDGRAETYIPIPEFPTPFAIRLRSSGWIAFGLAMFVYIDGEYQCNRNRRNLKIPDGSFPAQQAQVDFVVRQKEVYSNDGTFFGSKWKFEKLNLVSGTPGELAHPAPFDGEYIGTIEVVVLRCHPSMKSSLSDTAVGNSALTPAETYTSVGEQEGYARPRKGARLRNDPAAPQNAQYLPSADAFGGFSGLLDGVNDYHDPCNWGSSYGADGSWDEQAWVPDDNPNKGTQEWHSVQTGPRTGLYQPKGWPSPAPQQQTAYGSTGGDWMQPQGQSHGTPRAQLTPIIPGTPAVVINVAQPTPQPAGWGGNLTSNAPSVADSWASRKTVYEGNENNIETSQHRNNVSSGWPGTMAFSYRRAGSSRTSSVRPLQSTLGNSNQGPRSSPRADNFQSTVTTTGGDGWGNGNGQGPGWSNDTNENRGNNNQNQGSSSWDNNNNNNNNHQNRGANRWNSTTNQNEGDSSWNGNTDQNQGPSTFWSNNNPNHGGDSLDTSNNNQNQGGGNWENNASSNPGGGNNGNDQNHDSSWGINSYQNQNDNQNGSHRTSEQQHSGNTEPINISNEPNTSEQSGVNQPWNRPMSNENNNVNNQTQGASTPGVDRVNEYNKPMVWGTIPQQSFGTNIAPPSNSRFGGSIPNLPYPSHQQGNLAYTRPPAPIVTGSAPVQGVWSSPPLPPQISPCQPFVGSRILTPPSRTTATTSSRLGRDSTTTAYARPYWIGCQQGAVREDKLVAPKSIIQRSEPGEPLYTVSEEVAQRKKVSHQVQTGKPMVYTHKRMTPKYMDTHENPYAIFVFKYRSQALLEERFNITVVEPEIDEKKRMQDLPKDELIEHVLKMKTSSAKSSSPAPAAWTASPQHSVSGFGPSGLSNHDQGTTGIGIDMGQVSSKLNELQVSSNQGQNQNSPNPEQLWDRDTNQSALAQNNSTNTGVAWGGNGNNGAPRSANSQSGNAAIANSNRGGGSQNANGAASGNHGGTWWGGDTGSNSGLNGNSQSGGHPNSSGGGAFNWHSTTSRQGDGNENLAGNQDGQQW